MSAPGRDDSGDSGDWAGAAYGTTREQDAPAKVTAVRPRVDWARVSEVVAYRERERDEARAERDSHAEALREILALTPRASIAAAWRIARRALEGP